MKKICIKCNIEKDIDEFGIRKNSKDGRHYYCKDCANAAIEKHYEEHPEMLEVKKQRRIEYVINNPEKVAEQKYRSREKHRVKENAQALINRRTLRGRFNTGRNNNKRRGIPSNITFEEWCIFVVNPCHYCTGSLAETGFGVDRIDSNLGYEQDNLVPCCYICNIMKSTLSTEEFFRHIEKIRNCVPYQKWLQRK
jgi:hypothetical protein